MKRSDAMALLGEAIDELQKSYMERLRYEPSLLYDKLGEFKDLKQYLRDNLRDGAPLFSLLKLYPVSAPNMIDQQTALYYSQIACDKVITQSRLHIEFYSSLNKLGDDEKKILEELIDEFEQVKEYLKENLK